jgi:hypothetical protein
MDAVNRVFNQDGSPKTQEQLQAQAVPQAKPVQEPQAAPQAQASVAQQEQTAKAEIHKAPVEIPANVQEAINAFSTRFERFIQEEGGSNDLDPANSSEKSQGQKTLEALWAEVQDLNKKALASKLGNRNILDIEAAIPDAPKVVTDILGFVKGNTEAQKLFDEPVKQAVLNYLAYAKTVQQMKQSFANADVDKKTKIANLSQAVDPLEDVLTVFSAKTAVYSEQLKGIIKPFMEEYGELLHTHSKTMISELEKKAPDIKEALIGIGLSDITSVASRLEDLAPTIANTIRNQSTEVGNLTADFIQKNAKSVMGFALNAMGALKNVFKKVLNEVPGSRETSVGQILEEVAA